MGEVKTPGQVAYEAFFVLGRYRHLSDRTKARYESAAQAVVAADPVRTQALALVESLALLLEEWHGALSEARLIADAREFVRKAREASKP